MEIDGCATAVCLILQTCKQAAINQGSLCEIGFEDSSMYVYERFSTVITWCNEVIWNPYRNTRSIRAIIWY